MKRSFVVCVTAVMLLSVSCGKKEEDPMARQITIESVGGIEQEAGISNGEETSGAEKDRYVGEYNDYDNKEPNLEIWRNDDGTYRIDIGIFRLVFLEDAIGKAVDGGIKFNATAPDGNLLSGMITLEGDIATVTFNDEGWSGYSSVNEYRYYKTSDTPNGNRGSDSGECSVWDAEGFAKKVRKQILEGDYESLVKECSYPVQVDGEAYEDEETLLAAGILQNLPQTFLDVIREETCEDMFHNWQGFMLGNGEVWISEILNEDFSSRGMKIIGFNNIRGTGKSDTVQADMARAAYRAVLENLYETYTLPDGTNLGYDEISDLSGNQFAIYDIDRDGKEELIVIWTTTYMAGNVGAVYGYDSTSNTVKTKLLEYPMQTYYDNGVVEVGVSHNHGLAGDIADFWPYTFYQYDKNADIYAVAAVVDAWNKAYYEKDHDGKPFPDDMDADGDGVLYKVTAGDHETLMDLEEYSKWRDSFIGGAKKVEIPFVKMTEDSIYTKGIS